MESLLTQTDFRAVRDLPFCYLCVEEFKTKNNPGQTTVFATTAGLTGYFSRLNIARHTREAGGCETRGEQA